MYINVPTLNTLTDEWTHTPFETRDEFKTYLWARFKEPGKYNFDESSYRFNEQARKFNKDKVFCVAPMRSKDYATYWDFEKDKCRNGVIIKGSKDEWYLPRDYYMWLNFLPLYNKEIGKFGFPDVRDAQYHMALYEEIAKQSYKHCAILKKRQIASEQPHSEPVLGEHGWTTMGDVKPGDRLWNPDGTLTKILHKSNNGLSDVFEFEFADGRKTRCGIEHNWEVYDRAAKKTKILNTRDLIVSGLTSTPVKGVKKVYDNYRYSIRNTEPIEFSENMQEELLIPPYVLGCILGDGHINKTVYVAGLDEEVFDEIQLSMGDDYELVHGGYAKKNIVYKHRFREECKKYKNGQFGCNPLLRALDTLGLRDSNNKGIKHIPEVYKHASIMDRIELLQGLMDTDGYINATGNNIHFTNTNKTLVDDVAYVARSLGLKVKIVTKQGVKNTFYRLLFSGDVSIEIFRLTRKQTRLIRRFAKNTFDRVPLISITKLDYQEESSCIVVDNPNHLYITRDFIVTHNSYYHAGKMINLFFFEEGSVSKIAASLKDYVNDKGTWRFLEEYRNFLNTHTAWYRPCNPDKVLNWEQKIEITQNGKKRDIGLKSVIAGTALDKDPTNGVGGAVTLFFHEEAGIAPKMNETAEYLLPAMKSGMTYTGMFVAAGSVGNLEQCNPLKDMIYNPDSKDVLAIETNLMDENGEIGMCGLFIPEQWSMQPCIDEYGNSLVEKALEMIEIERADWKKKLKPDDYQLRISQKPTNIKEAFAHRTESVFPQSLVTQQLRRVEDKEYFTEYIDLSRDEHGKIHAKESRKIPISEFPLSPKTQDKEGVLVVWERPHKDPTFGMYYASVDPVSEGKTSTSNSLCSIYVYKTSQEVIVHKQDGTVESIIERDKLVAAWCGRFDDLNKTHERLELIIEWYNAWTLVENNVSLFIYYMIQKRKQKYLVPKTQMQFIKELSANTNVFQEYGWKNVGTLFKTHMLSYGIQFLEEELDHETKPDGTIVKTTYGVERIPDIMLLKEMQAYRAGLNVDRIVAFCALVAFAKVQESNRGYTKRVEHENTNLENSKKNTKLRVTPFRHMGGSSSTTNSMRMPRNPFKNMR